MAQDLLIIGGSGTGKSTSMETLDPKTTFIINVARKALPFKGWRANYTVFNKDNPKGNYVATDSTGDIIKVLEYISEKRPEILTIIIDDYQYVMANEYMRRTQETGFKKFNDIGQNAWNIVNTVKGLREDLTVIVMTHSETDLDAMGNKITKAKTIGKMMDNVITFEGMFTIVLYTEVIKSDDGVKYVFITQNNGSNTGKSPKGMFAEKQIPNDLVFVLGEINKYNN